MLHLDALLKLQVGIILGKDGSFILGDRTVLEASADDKFLLAAVFRSQLIAGSPENNYGCGI